MVFIHVPSQLNGDGMIIEQRAYARAGLLGNPSDGYFGKTISIIVRNFGAHVVLYESPDLHIEPHETDLNLYKSMDHFIESVGQTGYYGGSRLVKAAIKTFHDYCVQKKILLHPHNFTIRYDTSIPRQVGLAGSSAMITATLRALMQFYGVDIPPEILPNLILASETDELGIQAGLQDRVIQVYEGCVYMDFDRSLMESLGYGRYERIDSALLPNLYIAYKTELSKVSGKVHNTLKSRYDAGDPLVIKTLGRIAEIAAEGREAVLKRDAARLFRLVNENFDQREKIMQISSSNKEMIRTARECGASASFTGSGGSIIGTFESDAALDCLVNALKKLNAKVIRPVIQ
jgi:glucuronokinase